MSLYLIFGYAQTGSGTLTFPEDFEIVGYTTSEDEARDKCNELNKEVYEQEGGSSDDDPEEFGTQDWTDMVFDKFSGESVTLYEYTMINKI